MTDYHHVHLVTGREFDYEHNCRDCTFFTERTRRKVKVIGCAQAPMLDGQNFGQVREAFPACDLWVDAEKPRSKRTGASRKGRRA